MATAEVLSPSLFPLPLDLKADLSTVVDVQLIEDLSDEQTTPTADASEVFPHLLERKPDSHGPLISASLITTDFDALRFDTAASLQIIQSHQQHNYSTSTPRSHHLISSPYNDPNHLLDLRTLDTQSRLLSQALTFLKPIKDDYATGDYMSSFNWDEVLLTLRSLADAEKHTWVAQSFYTVIFRSKLNVGVDEQRLHDLDKNSHREAVESGGLLKYWFGKRDGEERNLATCECKSLSLSSIAEKVFRHMELERACSTWRSRTRSQEGTHGSQRAVSRDQVHDLAFNYR